MDISTKSIFEQMAATHGMGGKVFYTVGQAAEILGVSASTLSKEIAAGRMNYHLPDGRSSGRLVTAAWVDQWIQRGSHVGTDYEKVS